MTSTSSRSRGRWRTTVGVGSIALVMIASLMLTLMRHRTTYNIFVDEVTYSVLGRSVSLGHGVDLYGKQFYLHPPAFFYLEAATLDVFGRPRSLVSLILNLRILNGIIATIDCALMMLLVRKTAGRWWALGVGFFMAYDPFLLIWDGRVVLEPMATTASVLSLLCVVHISSLAREGDRLLPTRGNPRRRDMVLAVLAGLFAGIALLTKETYAFFGVVPFGVAFISGRPLPRRLSGAALAAALAVGAAYLGTIVAAGRLSAWWFQQHSGLLRAAGAKQISGFNQAGHASFASRILADNSYIGTYLILGLLSLTVVWSAVSTWRKRGAPGQADRTRAVLTLWAACGAFYVAFSAVRGAFEEQIFYPYLVIALPLGAECLSDMLRQWSTATRARVGVRATAVLLAGIFVYGLTVDARQRDTNDDAFASLVSWTHSHARRDSLVDSTDGISEFLIRNAHVGEWSTLREIRRHHPDFVVVATGLVNQGYVRLGPGLSPWLLRHATVGFSEHGQSIGQLIVYRIRWRTPPVV